MLRAITIDGIYSGTGYWNFLLVSLLVFGLVLIFQIIISTALKIYGINKLQARSRHSIILN